MYLSSSAFNKRMLSDWFSAALQTSRKCGRYMRSALILVLILFQFDRAVAQSDETPIKLCGLDENELYSPVNFAEYFDSLEARCSLEDDEALVMEYSFSEYCLSDEYQAPNLCDGDSDIRNGGVNDRCQLSLIEKYDENSTFKFSTKFKRRIYSTRLDGKAHTWFKSKGKGAIKLVGDTHVCL